MFGFPLSVYLLSLLLPSPEESLPPSVAFTFEFSGTTFSLLTTSLIAGAVSILALIFIILSWTQIFQNKDELVTDGLYGFVRHPQYLGILIIITVWLFAWPTLVTLVMWPILVIKYYKLAKHEEGDMENKYGERYLAYRNKVPMLIPH